MHEEEDLRCHHGRKRIRNIRAAFNGGGEDDEDHGNHNDGSRSQRVGV